MRNLALGILIGFTLGAAGTVQASEHHPNRIEVRWCPEDAVQVGQGQFDGTRWSWYKCIARDDLERVRP